MIDAQGAVLPGVTVVVRNQETGMVRDTVSGQDGTFIASGLVPGTYQLNAELQGFKKFERKDLRLEVGKTSSLDVSMSVGTIEVSFDTVLQPGSGVYEVLDTPPEPAYDELCDHDRHADGEQRPPLTLHAS